MYSSHTIADLALFSGMNNMEYDLVSLIMFHNYNTRWKEQELVVKMNQDSQMKDMDDNILNSINSLKYEILNLKDLIYVSDDTLGELVISVLDDTPGHRSLPKFGKADRQEINKKQLCDSQTEKIYLTKKT